MIIPSKIQVKHFLLCALDFRDLLLTMDMDELDLFQKWMADYQFPPHKVKIGINLEDSDDRGIIATKTLHVRSLRERLTI